MSYLSEETQANHHSSGGGSSEYVASDRLDIPVKRKATQPKTITRQRNSMNFRDTSQVNWNRAQRWHSGARPWTNSDWAMALGGEYGELCNALKKLNRVVDGIASANNDKNDDKPMPDLMKKIETELGDVFCYLDLLATHLGIDLETAVINTFNRISEREGLPERLPY